MKCFYHDDMDGRAAAFCVHAWAGILPLSDGSYPDVDFIPMQYETPFPFYKVEPGEQVWIVDFSLQRPGDWERLLKLTKDVTWIDHHKTAIEQAEGKPWSNLPGLREEGHDAACVLAFRYIHWYSDRVKPVLLPHEQFEARVDAIPEPRALLLVSDRDTWSWDYGKETAYFHAGMSTGETYPHSEIWRELCMDQSEETLNNVLAEGGAIVKFKQQFYSELRKSIGFHTSIDGHSAIALNIARTGSEGFGFPKGWQGKLPDEPEILMPFYWTGEIWTVSLYSKSVDVSEIAKKRGGGGHPGAAGFQSKEMPKELQKTP